MKKCLQFLVILLCASPFAAAKSPTKPARPLLPPRIMQADTVFIDCTCPRALAVARQRALQQLQAWGRFRLVENLRQADLVFLFSGNKYLGDYLTRDGPDKRPVAIESTIMTVIDAHTGEALWTDSRRWGSWRVDGATRDLVGELKDLMASQVRRWTLNDLLMCAVTPVYESFGHITSEEAVKSGAGVTRLADHLMFESAVAPEFCRKGELLVGSDNKIIGFQVLASQADDLNIDEVLQHADRFDFTGGKYSNGETVYFSARSKDKKMLIQFGVQGHRSVLSSVSYYY
jgi:hypothetical protein